MIRHARVASVFFGAAALTAVPAFAQQGDDEPGVESGNDGEDDAPAAAGAKPKKKKTVEGSGMAATDTLYGGQSPTTSGGDDDGEWKFQYKGFFRAPMRLGHQTNDGNLSLHAPPAVPDANYTNWMYTNANPGPWIEMLLQYGNNRVMMTTAIASYNITSGSYRELQAQLGIDRAFLTLNFPEALGDRGGLALNVGIFSDRYGTAGRYDAGAYETYLFGRTRMAGETLTGNIWLTDDISLVVEHGIGAKTDQQKWTRRAINPADADKYQPYEPYPGPAQQGTTLVHHAHVGLNMSDMLFVTGHYINVWTKDERAGERDVGQPGMPMLQRPYRCEAGDACQIQVVGLDAKLIGGWLGEGYIGYSNIKADNAEAVSDAIEVLHSQGGWQLTNNYFAGTGNGKMHSVLFQYQFSLAAFLLRPQAWWGDGSDLVLRVFGMYNKIDAENYGRNGGGASRFKWGFDALYTPLPLFGFGGRFDVVQPDLDDPAKSFMVISPRAILRTRFVTHEMIIFQYSMYSYKNGINDLLPFPYGGEGSPYKVTGPDKGVFTISAQMWW